MSVRDMDLLIRTGPLTWPATFYGWTVPRVYYNKTNYEIAYRI